MVRGLWSIKQDLEEKQRETHDRLAYWRMFHPKLLGTVVKQLKKIQEKHGDKYRRIRVTSDQHCGIAVTGVRKETKREMRIRVNKAKKDLAEYEKREAAARKSKNISAAWDLAKDHPEELLRIAERIKSGR